MDVSSAQWFNSLPEDGILFSFVRDGRRLLENPRSIRAVQPFPRRASLRNNAIRIPDADVRAIVPAHTEASSVSLRHPDLITTDGFLFPNQVLQERGLMERKGFPESFDLKRLRGFLADIKSGRTAAEAPVYSHIAYDILPEEKIRISRPDILIVEGLNVLQPAVLAKEGTEIPFVSDYFDFSIYIDAEAEIVQRWYVERFMGLRQTAFRAPGAYFERYAELDDEAAEATAIDIWTRINLKNLNENILPTRARADLILHKGADHRIDRVLLRKI